jgi:Tle cognate immunity protein 4 C-terminal domain/Tle cognate immunity protein 4 N-terminal domain
VTTRRRVLTLFAPLLLLAAGSGKADTPAKGSTPMPHTQTIATRPLCVGRLLIDVPADAKVIGTQTTSSSTAGTISVQVAVKKVAFKAKMEDIETKLRNAPHQTEGSRLSEVLRPDDATYVFRYRKNDVGARVYQIDGYRWAESNQFTINSNASNSTFRSVIDEVKRGLLTMKPRDTWTVPTEPGFCFDNGFLPGKDSTFEATGVQLTFKAYPGLMIALETQTSDQGASAGPDLITRVEEGQGILEPNQRATMLRKNAKRSVDGRMGQEVMLKRQVEEGVRLTGYLEINAEPSRIDAPGISFAVALDPSKQKGGATSKEEDVLHLWDAVIQSLRLRPGAI